MGPKKFLARRWLLLVLLAAILILAVPPLFRLGLRTFGFQYFGLPVPQASPYAHNTQLRVGSMEGVPLAIPGNLLEFAIEYMDKSAWEAKGKGCYESKTSADPIRNFALYVRWPDLVERTAETEQSYMASRGPGMSDWIGISVFNDYARTAKLPLDQRTGVEWLLKLHLSRLSEEWISKHPTTVRKLGSGEEYAIRDVRYEFRERDPVTGLQAAIPVGADAHWSFLQNRALYWQGDRDKEVSVLIECLQGTAIKNPTAVFNCRHTYLLPELGAYVKLSYTPNWLPHWQELQSKTRDFVLSLRTQPTNVQ